MIPEEEIKVPYMSFTRNYKNGRITWKREFKEPLTQEQTMEIMMSSEESVKKLPTEDKYLWLCEIFYGYRNSCERPDISLTILAERKHLLRDSFEQFRTITHFDLRRTIKIHFLDEISRDAGGLIREWFSVLISELFSESLGLFVRVKTPDIAYTINTHAKRLHYNCMEYFYFCGQLLAKALFERIPVKAYLGKFLLKQLTSEELVADDLRYFDTELWNSMEYIRTNKLEDEIGTFVVTQKNYITKKEEQIELKPNGRNIPVNEQTKQEFITLIYQYYLKQSIEKEFTELAFGFFSLLPGHVMSTLDFEELEFFLCGDQEISLNDWKEHTQYRGCYNSNHPVIKWFWEILSQLNAVELEKFFQYCTGSARVPAEGFGGLSSNGCLCLFTIAELTYNKVTAFPIAHTCFNKLDLPVYPNKREMEEVLRTIITNPLCYQFSSE